MQRLTKKTLKIFWQHSKRYWVRATFVVVGITTMTALDTYKPLLYKRFFDAAVYQGTAGIPVMIHILALLLGVSVVIRILWTSTMYMNNYFQNRVMSDLLNTCYAYLQKHSYNFFNNSFVGSLVTKVRRFQSGFEIMADQVYLDLGRSFLIIAFIVFVFFQRSPILGVAILIWVTFFVSVNLVFARYKIKYDLARAEIDTKTTGHLADTITNNQNIKLFASFDTEYRSFKRLTDELFARKRRAWDVGNRFEFFIGIFTISLEVIMLYLGVRLWQKGILTLGDFALIQAYIVRILDKSWGISGNIKRIYEALADANEMTQILDQPHELEDKPGAKQLKVTAGKVEFLNVQFYYRKETPVFRNFNLTIEPSERLALIGPSGGGKTTIVKLLFRFIDIQKGAILIDGQNIADVTQDSLRKNISLVPQDPILFHRSLFENIRYGNPKTNRAEVIAAAKAAHCHEFISRFPEGYDTFVGERGVKLSGGERQRVTIARAILKNAPILVLDEATSSLDSESEHLIQDALTTLMKGKTTIVIAHRLSTIMAMDRIVVIEKGKITEQGKHEELIKAKQGTYQKLWEIQAGSFA